MEAAETVEQEVILRARGPGGPDAGAALAAAAEARPEVIVVDPWRVAADPAGLAGRLAA
jgi:hypothetical protein